MSKSIVLFDSRTNNTKKIAEAIALGLGTTAIAIETKPPLDDYDLIAFGSWVKKGTISSSSEKYLHSLPEKLIGDKKFVLFLTSSFPEKRNEKTDLTELETTFQAMRNILEKKQARVLEKTFTAVGAVKLFSFGCGLMKRGHPTEEELEKATQFGRDLEEK
jgi:flavodoxin